MKLQNDRFGITSDLSNIFIIIVTGNYINLIYKIKRKVEYKYFYLLNY